MKDNTWKYTGYLLLTFSIVYAFISLFFSLHFYLFLSFVAALTGVYAIIGGFDK